jgi:hypothetical protein
MMVDATARTRLKIRIPEADLRNFALRRRAHVMPSETWPYSRTATWWGARALPGTCPSFMPHSDA